MITYCQADPGEECRKPNCSCEEVSRMPEGKSDETKAFEEWWKTTGLEGEEWLKIRWAAWNGWLGRANAATNTGRKSGEPLKIIKLVREYLLAAPECAINRQDMIHFCEHLLENAHSSPDHSSDAKDD